MTAPSDLPSLVDEGRRLIAEATPGPWEVWGEDDLPDHDDLCIAAFDIVAPNAGEEPPSLYVCNVGSNGGTRSWLAPAEAEEKWPVSLANAKLIALALNSFPLLLAVAEAAGKVHGYLEEELLEARGCVGQGEVTGEACEWHRLLLALDAALRGEVKP